MTAECCEDSRAPWPHHSCFKGVNASGAGYESLSQSNFVYGFLDQMDSEKFKENREPMIVFLRELMQDCRDCPGEWATIKGFVSVFLVMLERGTVKWTDREEIHCMKGLFIFHVRSKANRSNESSRPPHRHRPKEETNMSPSMPSLSARSVPEGRRT